MDIGFSSVNRMIPPQVVGIGGGTPAPKTSAPNKTAGGWVQREVGVSDLTRVTGEERVEEAALRRDDDLGRLLQKAFDPKTASAALPPLGLGGMTPYLETT